MINHQPVIDNTIQLSPISVHEEVVNGIEISYLGGADAPIVKLEFLFNAGSKYQDKPLTASIGFDLLHEGFEQLKGADFREQINGLGVYYGMETTKDYGSLTFYVLERNLAELLKLVRGILTQPVLSEDEFNRLRQKQKNDFLIDSEKTSFLARQSFSERLFFDTAYGKVAYLESFDDVNYEDVTDFMETYFVKASFKMLVAGFVSSSVKEQIRLFCNTLAKRAPMPVEIVAQLTPKNGLHEIKKDGEQCSLIMGIELPQKGHRDDHLIGITNTILGGYFGSRLMQNIREDKGWTYGISSMIMTYQDASILAIAADVLKDKGEGTMAEIEKEIKLLQTVLVPQKELDTLISYLKGKVIRSFDGAFEQADRYFSIKSFNLGWDYYFDYVKMLEHITPEMIREAAKKYFNWDAFTIIKAGGQK